MIFGKGFGILDNLLFRLWRRNDVKFMLASGATNLNPFGRNSRIVQIKLGQTGGTSDNHKKSPSLQFFDIMMKGIGKIKDKMRRINKISNAKAQNSKLALGLRLKVRGNIICLTRQTSNLKHLWWGFIALNVF
jgi:hypothetical protein